MSMDTEAFEKSLAYYSLLASCTSAAAAAVGGRTFPARITGRYAPGPARVSSETQSGLQKTLIRPILLSSSKLLSTRCGSLRRPPRRV